MPNFNGHERPGDPTCDELRQREDVKLVEQLHEWAQQAEQLQSDLLRTARLIEHRIRG